LKSRGPERSRRRFPVNIYITLLALSAPPAGAADSATLPCGTASLLQIRGEFTVAL
jgi:hypothetical protein